MRRASLTILSVLLLLVVVSSDIATAQDGDAAPGHQQTQSPAHDGGCDGLVWGLEHLCDGVTGTIGNGVEAVVAGGAKAALSAIVEFVVDGAGWFLGQLAGLVDRSTRPDVTAGWFQGAYRDMAAIALVGLLPFLLLAIIHGIVRQDPGQLLRSTFVFVPLAALGTGAAIVIVDMLVAITDEMSTWAGRSMGSDLSEFATGLGTAVGTLAGPSGGVAVGLAALIGAAVIAFATFVIWLELLLRQAAIYVAVLFLPLGFMAMVWPATAHWLRRLVQGLVAIILSKFVILAVMALAASALDANVAEDGYGAVVAGGALLSLAALAPYVLLRLIPVFEAGLTSQFEGTFRRPTAALAPPNVGRSQIAQMLRQRAGGNGSGGAAGSPALATVGGDGGVLGGIRAGGTVSRTSESGLGATAGAAGGAAAAAGVGLATTGADAARKGAGRATATADEATRAPARPSHSSSGHGSSTRPSSPVALPVADARRSSPPPPERPVVIDGGDN